MEQSIYNKEEYLYTNFHKLFRHSNININSNILQTDSIDKFSDNVGLINSLVRKGINPFNENKKRITPNLLQIFTPTSEVSNEQNIKNNLENLIIELTTINKNQDIVTKISDYLATIKSDNILNNKISIILKEILDNSNNVLFFRYNIITYNDYAIDKLLESLSLFTTIYTDQKNIFDKNIVILNTIFHKLKQTFTYIGFNSTPLKIIPITEKINTPITNPQQAANEEKIKKNTIEVQTLKVTDHTQIIPKLLESTQLIKDAEKAVELAHNTEVRGGNINYNLDYLKKSIRHKISLITPKQTILY